MVRNSKPSGDRKLRARDGAIEPTMPRTPIWCCLATPAQTHGEQRERCLVPWDTAGQKPANRRQHQPTAEWIGSCAWKPPS